jgi:hypothetical protein
MEQSTHTHKMMKIVFHCCFFFIFYLFCFDMQNDVKKKSKEIVRVEEEKQI